MPQLSERITGCGGYFQYTLLGGSLCVISLPPNLIPSAAWWIIRQYVVHPVPVGDVGDDSFNSLLMDDDGISLICSPNELLPLRGLPIDSLHVNEQRWRALVIQIVGSATQFPGAVFHLANNLSEAGVSILHISTFDREIFLVQDKDVEVACEVLKRTTVPVISDQLLTLSSSAPHSDHSEVITKTTTNNDNHSSDDNINILKTIENLEESSLANIPKKLNEFALCVLPGYVMLARLSDDTAFQLCGDILLRMLLYDPRYCPLEKNFSVETSASSSSSSSTSHNEINNNNNEDDDNNKDNKYQASFMWGLWRCQDEVTFLLDEEDILKFPEGCLTVSPQRWKVVKLAGRVIDFDETGIVCSMSKIESSVPTLNISTATSNCTLIPEDRLHQALTMLSSNLNCKVYDYEL